MSSILEALRELEGSKPSSQRSRVAWAGGEAEERSPLRRAAELLGIVAFGLAVGGAGFALVVWLGAASEAEPEARTRVAAAAPARDPIAPPPTRRQAPASAAPPSLAPAAPASPVPGWLGRMGAPRGRVEGGDDAQSAAAADTPAPPRAAGLSLVRVRYAESRAERTATLRIDGGSVVLHEGETADGIELQLVTPTGAYVRRGGEVIMLEQPR